MGAEASVTEGNVIEAIRGLAGDQIAGRAAQVDRDRTFPNDACQALAAAGGLGLVVPAEQNGAGGGLTALAEAAEAIGGACGSTGMVFLMHSVAAATLAGAGGNRADEILRRMADGAVGTLAFSERGTGAHFYSPELDPEPHNGGIRISGRKSFVTSGGHAAFYLALVQSGNGGTDCYVIDAATAGLSFDGSWEGLGMAGNSSVAMELDGVELTDADRVGASGDGTSLVFNIVAPYFLVGLASVSVGIAAAALASATEHVKDRTYPDGSSLAEIQSTQHALADMDISVRQARLLVKDAACLGEAGGDDALAAIMEAKVAATDAAASVTQSALEICGGQAYTPSLPIERHLRDARAGAVMAPTNAVLRNWIGKTLTGLPVP